MKIFICNTIEKIIIIYNVTKYPFYLKLPLNLSASLSYNKKQTHDIK